MHYAVRQNPLLVLLVRMTETGLREGQTCSGVLRIAYCVLRTAGYFFRLWRLARSRLRYLCFDIFLRRFLITDPIGHSMARSTRLRKHT